MTPGDDRPLEIVFVEPWDFVTDVGDRPYTASVRQRVNSDELELVLRIDDAPVYRGTSCEPVRVVRRHEDDLGCTLSRDYRARQWPGRERRAQHGGHLLHCGPADAMIREYDVVKLIRPLPERGIEAGAEGTVVMVYEPGVVEVEFADARADASTRHAICRRVGSDVVAERRVTCLWHV